MPSTNRKFTMIGKGKVVHTVTTKAADLKDGAKGSQCPQVRKAWVAGSIKPKAKGLSPEAALAIDNCTRCESHAWAQRAIEEAMTPAQKRAQSKERRDDTLARQKAATQTKGEAKKVAKAQKAKAEPKPKKASKSAEPRERKRKDKDRSTGGDSEGKAQVLADFAKEHGWSATVEKDGGHMRVTAVRGDETINVWFIDGKYDPARPAETVVGSWSGKLRGAHSARRQMANEGRDRPHPEPGKGRSGPRAKASKEEEVPADESPEDAAKRVPFLIDDEPVEIMAAIAGKTIKWRNSMTKTIEQAQVPVKSKRMSIQNHPKKPGHRMLCFMEVVGRDDQGRDTYGKERVVGLASIVRVIG